MKIVFYISLAFTCIVNAAEPQKIIRYYFDEVEICESSTDGCTDVSFKKLPDPSVINLIVTDSKKNGMLEFKVNNKTYWIHESEVELSIKSSDKVVCTNQKISKSGNRKTYASYGLGGCE